MYAFATVIKESMGLKGVLCAIASICLLFSLIAAGLRSKKGGEEASVINLINLLEKNGDMAELLWAHCRQDLMHVSGAEDLELKAEDKSRYRGQLVWNSRWINDLDRKRLFKVLLLKAEHSVLDCFKRKNIMFPIPVEEITSENQYNRYLDFVYTRRDAPRRRELIQNFAGAPGPSPAVGSPSLSLAVGTPSPSPAVGSPSPFPEAQSHYGPPSPPFFPRDVSGSNLQPTSSEQTSSGSSSSFDVESNKKKTVLIAVLVTASVTLVVSLLLFLCFRKTCGTGAVGRNDESPLLSLSMSDYSVASPQKSFGIEKPYNQSIDTIPSHKKMAGDICLDSNNFGHSKVEIPIGTVAGAGITSAENSAPATSGIAGLPPLKPPPGRENSSLPTIGSGKRTPASPPPAPAPSPPPPPPPLPKRSHGPHPPVPGAPPPPPVPSSMKNGPRPPTLPSGGVPPPRPPVMGFKPPRSSPLGSNNPSTSSASEENDDNAPKTKLKPFFWDKVLANPDSSMVWHQIKSGSFQFNEEMIETLFGYAPPDKNLNKAKGSSSLDPSSQYIQIIEPKKAQNLAILLKALNVTTEEVCDALQEGNELPSEFIQTLLKMAPTVDEELKLRNYSGDLSRLGTAERFLKVLIEIPFSFKRLECLLFMGTLQEEESVVKDSFATLEAACTELRKSRLFLKLLEAVLKTGNRMNDGTFRGGAQAFKLDTLLKLSDVKGKDGKTTLLHFVVQEIIRSEGIRAARAAGASRSMSSVKSDDLADDSAPDTEEQYRSIGLQKVSGLSNELESVKRAAVIDADGLTGTVAKLGHALLKARDFLNSEMKSVEEENGFHQTLRDFVQNAEVDIMWLLEEEKRIMALVKSTGDYFHGNSAKDEGLRLFVIVRDFLIILDKVCREVKITATMQNKTPRKEVETGTPTTPSETRQSLFPDPRLRLIPAIKDRRMDSSSSDDDEG